MKGMGAGSFTSGAVVMKDLESWHFLVNVSFGTGCQTIFLRTKTLFLISRDCSGVWRVFIMALSRLFLGSPAKMLNHAVYGLDQAETAQANIKHIKHQKRKEIESVIVREHLEALTKTLVVRGPELTLGKHVSCEAAELSRWSRFLYVFATWCCVWFFAAFGLGCLRLWNGFLFCSGMMASLCFCFAFLGTSCKIWKSFSPIRKRSESREGKGLTRAHKALSRVKLQEWGSGHNRQLDEKTGV